MSVNNHELRVWAAPSLIFTLIHSFKLFVRYHEKKSTLPSNWPAKRCFFTYIVVRLKSQVFSRKFRFHSAFCVGYEASEIASSVTEDISHTSKCWRSERWLSARYAQSRKRALSGRHIHIFCLHSKFIPITCDTERVLSTNDRFTVACFHILRSATPELPVAVACGSHVTWVGTSPLTSLVARRTSLTVDSGSGSSDVAEIVRTTAKRHGVGYCPPTPPANDMD